MRLRSLSIYFLLLLTGVPLLAGQAKKKDHFVIVAPKAFHKSLTPFVKFKKEAYDVSLVPLEKILAGEKGADDPEKLKKHLYKLWSKNQLNYVLLVGDVDVLPVRYMVLDRITPAAFDYSFYPSDLYYADLAKQDKSFENWNSQTNDFHALYFGEVRGEKNKSDPINFDRVDYLPEVAVGRWPVSDMAELNILISKSIHHEQSLSKSAEPLAGLISVGGWVDTRRQMDQWGNRLTNHWKIEKRYYADRYRNDKTAAPVEKEVIGLLNSGARLLIHTGHGETWCWHDSLTLQGLNQLTNENALGIVISAGCHTANFAPLPPYQPYVDIYGKEHKGTDQGQLFTTPPPPPAPYQKGAYDPNGLGEQLIKGSKQGAVAYIGCNTGSQPCALTLVEGFVDAAGKGEAKLGDCWNSAIRYYYTKQRLEQLKPNNDWYPPSIFFQGMKFMVFGDPTLPVR